MARGNNRSWICRLFLIVSIGLLSQPAGALNIVLTFDSGASDSPSFDPTGVKLQAVMSAVEFYWQDIIETAGTLNVTYYYDNLSDASGTLADHLNQGTSGGKPTDAQIRVDTRIGGVERLWYFDTTPTNNSEFNMQQVLVRDLTAAQKSNWYNGTPKDMLEVSYRGAAKGTAPADAQNGFDLFSVLLHEMGHGVGMTANVAAGETADNDYDFDSTLVWGGTMAVETRSAGNPYHLDGTNMLMFPTSNTGTRTLPSASDIFAMEAASNWGDTKIDLRRQDFTSVAGSQNWNNRANWAGNQVPGAADEAYVRLQTSNPTVTLTANASCISLFVGEGDNVQTSSRKLDVGGTATVDGYNSDLMVSTGGELEAATVKIQNQAEVYMTGGLIDAGRVTIDSGTYLTGATGSPTVDVQTKLTNNGIIRAIGSGTLTFTSSGGAVWDLDGAGSGVVQAVSGNVNFASGSLSDAFDGTMTIGSGRYLAIAQAWSLGSGGLIDLNGGSTFANRARVTGGLITASGGQIDVSGLAHMDSAITFSGASVSIPTASDTLELNAATTFAGGSFTGLGKLKQDGAATVTANTTISVATYDWDGGGGTITTVNSGKTFTLNVTRIDAGNDVFDGTINLNGGILSIDNAANAWTMSGTLNMNSVSGTPTVAGDKMIVTDTISVVGGTSNVTAEASFQNATVTVSAGSYFQLQGGSTFNGGSYTGAGRISVFGVVNVTGNTTIGAIFRTVGGSTINVSSGVALTLNGAVEYYGTTHGGAGTITQNGNATVLGTTTINVATYDWDGAGASTTTINSGRTFTLDVTNVDLGGSDQFDGTINNSGTLSVSVGDNLWVMDGVMNMTGGNLTGDQVWITGAINATSGTNEISSDMNLRSTSTTTVNSGSTLRATGQTVIEAGSDTTVSGRLELNGATTWKGPNTMNGTGLLYQGGDSTVASNTTIGVATYDWDGTGASTTTINPGVTLTINSTKIDAGNPATDGFDGTLNVGSGATLSVNTSSAWRMEGTLNMNNAGGVPTVTGSAEMVVIDTIAVTGGLAYISSPVEFTSAAVVTVPASTELELNGATTFNGGSFTGDGTIQQDGAATVDSATTIAVDQYDMDGTSGSTTLTLNAHLTLNVTNVDTGNNVFNGTLNIWNPGRLIVNTPAAWTMAGTMNLYQNAHANQWYVMGSDMNITGNVYVTGLSGIGSTIHLYGTITLGDPGDMIQLGSGNANTINGGTIVGPGTVSSGGGSLTGSGSIGATVNFISSADLLARGGTLTVTGSIKTVGTIGTAAPSGKLDVTGAWNTNVADELKLVGGEVTGGFITNDGTTTGYGTITSLGFHNNGTLTASGGTLTLSTTGSPDLDGSGTEDGVINTGSDTVHVTYAYGSLFVFNGQLNVGLGGLFRMDYYGLSIGTATPGEVNLAGGTYLAPDFWQSQTLNVSAALSTIDSSSRFYASGTNTLNADLQLKNYAKIFNGATFTGTGSLIVAAGAVVDMESGVSLGVSVINNGTLNLGASPGLVTIDGNFTQNSKGQWNIEIAGLDNSNPLDPDFDALDVTGTAWLDGVLDVSLIDKFAPNTGDIFDVLTASAIVDGGLSLIDPTGLFTWSLEAGDTILRLVYDAMLLGDLNGDGSADNLDITPFIMALLDGQAAFEVAYPSGEYWAGDVNEDNSFDNLDITPFVNLLLGGAQEVPEPTTLVLLALTGVAVLRRRR